MRETLSALLGASVISIVPLFLTCFYNPDNKTLNTILISLAVGCLLGDAVFHLIPEMLDIDFASNRPTLNALFIGIMVFFGLEQYLQIYHCGHLHHSPTTHHQLQPQEEGTGNAGSIHSSSATGPLIIVSDTMHNMVDGLAIGVAFRASFTTGISTVIATLLHEIPHELSDYAVLGHTGYSKQQIIIYSLMSSTASLFGALVGAMLGKLMFFDVSIEKVLLAFTAGNFLYLALADLTPELMHGHDDRQIGVVMRNALVIMGASLLYVLKCYLH